MKKALILFFCVLPAIADAAGFEIRSGEHNGFSRLVIYLDRPREWDVRAVEDGYDLSVPDSPQGFDTSEVFEFIPKRRLTAVRSAPDRLTLTVPCDCPVQAFAYRPDIIVLDIHSEQPDPDSIPESEIVMPFSPEPETPRFVEEAVEEVEIAKAAPSGSDLSLSHWLEREIRPMRATDVLGFAPPAQPADQRLNHAELVAGIAQAATHGLVRLSDPDARAEAAQFPGVPGLRIAGDQLSVRDTLIRARPPGVLPETARYCLPGHLFDLPEWGDPEMPAALILSDLRTEGPIPGADGAIADGVIAMIRSYLFLGFGSEAAELVRTYRMSKRDERVYLALARIVDFPGQADLNPLADQLYCDSPAALWAFVATGNLPMSDQEVRAETIVRGFQRLPWWLRLHLGETAAANFILQGDAVSAEAVRASVARARAAQAQRHDEGDGSDAQVSAEAEGEAPHTVSDRARRMSAAQAMLRRHGAEGRLPMPEDRAEISALVLETRGSDESIALLESYVEFAASSDDILEAERLLTVLSRSRFSNAYPIRDSWNQVLAAAVAQPSHDLFLGLLARNKRVFSRVPPDQAIADAVVARLIATGLPESAATYAEVLGTQLANGLAPSQAVNSFEVGVAEALQSQEANPVATARPSPGVAVPGAPPLDGWEDAYALRDLLAASVSPADPALPAQTIVETDETGAVPRPAVSPLDTLLASEAAIEILDRVLGSEPDADS